MPYMESRPLAYDFNPTPDMNEELDKLPSQDGASDEEDTDSWKDVEGSNSSSNSESGRDSDDMNG